MQFSAVIRHRGGRVRHELQHHAEHVYHDRIYVEEREQIEYEHEHPDTLYMRPVVMGPLITCCKCTVRSSQAVVDEHMLDWYAAPRACGHDAEKRVGNRM